MDDHKYMPICMTQEQFKKQIEQARADERKKIESILRKKFKVEALYEYCNTADVAKKYNVGKMYIRKR